MSTKQIDVIPNAIDGFRALVKDDPNAGIGKLPAIYGLVENCHFEGNSYVRLLAGGIPESISWALYNAVGDRYTSFTREQKDFAIKQTLAIMDEITYSIVNGIEGSGHTSGIREPFYLGEIATVRRLYWPGLDEGRRIIKHHNGNFKEIKTDLITKDGKFKQGKVDSDFLVAYAFLRKDISNFGERFAETFDRDFIERTVIAVTKMRISTEKTEEEISKGLDRLRFLLPKSLHGSIESASKITDWVDKKQFP